MAYQQRTFEQALSVEDNADPPFDHVDEVAPSPEDYHETYAGEGAEFPRDDVSHHSPPDEPEPSQPASCRSESPLFEPMSSDAAPSENDDLLEDALAALPEDDQSSTPLYVSTLDGLKRARVIKAQINKNLSLLAPKTMRTRTRTVEEDPDNQAIKTMRQEHSMSWEAIVTQLNKERLERGEPQTWTSAAVYSRFVRNAPRIAAAQGEIGFCPRDYMHLRNPASHPAAQLPGAINKPSGYQYGVGGARKRVRDDEHAAKDLADNLRHMCADTLSEQAKILEQADMTELMMEAVASVEQEFWGTVANALEKTTGKFFDAKVLESRYHSVKW